MPKKNALRKHYVAEVPAGETEPTWLRLANRISEITDGTSENIEEEVWYDSPDGTPESTVTTISEKWDAKGQYEPNDPAQKLIAEKKRKTGEDRKIMHKIEFTDGKEVSGKATVLDIIAGGGNAGDFEEFSCSIVFDSVPTEKETPVAPARFSAKTTATTTTE